MVLQLARVPLRRVQGRVGGCAPQDLPTGAGAQRQAGHHRLSAHRAQAPSPGRHRLRARGAVRADGPEPEQSGRNPSRRAAHGSRHHGTQGRHDIPQALDVSEPRRARANRLRAGSKGWLSLSAALGGRGSRLVRRGYRVDMATKNPHSTRRCSLDGCRDFVHARNLCSRHYRRLLHHGSPLAGGPTHYPDPEDAFAARTKHRGECLIWTGGKTSGGYGVMCVSGKVVGAHVYAWTRSGRELRAGYLIDHRDHCDPACVEVEHLREATRHQNMANRRGAQASSRSRVRNVRQEANGTYSVHVGPRGSKVHEYGFATVEGAAERARELRSKLFADFAGKG